MKRVLYYGATLALVSLSLSIATPASAAKEGQTCGTIADIKCDEGLFCEHPPGNCGTMDSDGVCEKKPEACTAQDDPVCACDAKQYSNDCTRRMDGAQLDYKGPCKKKPDK